MYYIIPYKLDINWFSLQRECLILITYVICCKCSDKSIGLDCICLTTTHVLQEILAVIWDALDRTPHILINIMVHTYTCLRDTNIRGQFIWEGFLITDFGLYTIQQMSGIGIKKTITHLHRYYPGETHTAHRSHLLVKCIILHMIGRGYQRSYICIIVLNLCIYHWINL